jgi:HYR domain/Domain of unknown function DUF11/Calx-beta domain
MNSPRRFKFGQLITSSLCAITLATLGASMLSVASSSSDSNPLRRSPFNVGHPTKLGVAFRGEASVVQALESGSARARALASTDLDSDGAPDLVAGYEWNGIGIVTVQRGNPDAFAPTDRTVFEMIQSGYNPDSLQPFAEAYVSPEPVDFLQVGDFNGGAQKDVLLAARGGRLYLLAGDGKGGLDEPEQIALPGAVTAMATGEFNAADGRTDVLLGIAGPNGHQLLLVFQEPTGPLFSAPLVFRLESEATAIQIGALDNDAFMDAAVTEGSAIRIIHGWGRAKPPSLQSRVESIDLESESRGLAIGNFIWNRGGAQQIAVLDEAGVVHILHRGTLNAQPFSIDEVVERARARQTQVRGNIDVEAGQCWQSSAKVSWATAREIVVGGVTDERSDSRDLLRRSHVGFRETDDLLLLARSERKLQIVRQVDIEDGLGSETALASRDLITHSVDLADAPAAVLALPQKLNGERSLVLLDAQSVSPVLIPVAPTATITVDRTDDTAAASACTGSAGDCSLRGAVTFANANAGTVINLPAGTYTLNINGSGGCVIENSITGNTIGDLEINQSTTITGAGSTTTIIRQLGVGGGGFVGDRVMCLNVPIAAGINYTFSGFTVTGGRESSGIGGAGIVGGAKDNTLTLTDVTISNNRDTALANYSGGGLSITGGSVTITNCLIGGTNAPGTDRSDLTLANSAGPDPAVDPSGGPGGGIGYSPGDPNGATPSTGTLTITGTTVQHNTAGSTASGGGGADLYTHNLGTGSVSISNSTFANNQALGINNKGSGGAIIVESIATTVASTSFTSNTATNLGGAIYVGGGSLLLNGTSPSITFTGNTATNGASSVGANGPVQVSGTNTIIGGSVAVFTNGVWTNNTDSTLSPTDLSILGGTLTCNNSTMNVSGNFVINHEATKGGILNANTGTINIQGNLNVDLSNGGSGAVGQFNAGTGTINFNGAGAQSITNASSITFNNLTDSNTSQALSANNSFAVNAALNVNGANAVFNPAAAAVISGTGTLTGTGTARVTRTAATADFLTQYTITNKTLANLTVDYNGAGNQTVNNTPAYGHLRISGTGTKTLQGATSASGNLTVAAAVLDVSASNFALNVGGNWTNNVGGSGFNPRSGTVTFNGSSGTQTLAGNTTFFNLTLNNSGAATAFGATSTTIGNNFVTTAGTMNGGTSTIIFTGAGGSISGAGAKNFNNLVINGSASISNTTGGNTSVANDYTNNGTFTQGASLTTTFSTGADGTHSLLGTGTSTFGNFTIDVSNTVDAGSHNFSVVGATFNATGTFTGNASTATFNGSVAQAITGDGAKDFSGLTINNASGVTLNNGTGAVDALVSGALTLTTDLTIAAGAILQQSGPSAGGADAIGTVRRTDLTATPKTFGNPNVTISVDAGTAPSPMDVTLAKMAPPDFTTSLTRTYTLAPTGGAGISATVKLHYLNAELNGNAEAKLGLWKKVGGVWAAQGRTGAVDTINKSVTLTGVSSFSDWTLADLAELSVTVTPTSVAEDSGTPMVYTFTRTGATTTALTVNFSVGGTATPPGGATPDYGQTGADTFTTTTGTVTIGIGSASADVNITPITDTAVEPDETVTLMVAAGPYNIVPTDTATGTITNDDTDVSVAVSPASVAEDGATNLVYTFTRQGVTTGALTANFSIGGTATPPGGATPDYTQTGAATFTPPTGTVTFGAGVTTVMVPVDPNADTTVEPDETVDFTVTAGAGYTVGTPSLATGTITNDDTDVTLSVSPASVGEDGSTPLVYTFTRTGVTMGPLTVSFTIGGTAAFTSDYTQSGAATFDGSTGTVLIGDGNTMATVTLTPVDDVKVEGAETVSLTLSASPNYDIGTPGAVTGSIVDNDTATIALASASSNAPEQTTPHNVGVTLVINANGAGTPMLERSVMVNVQDLLTGSATGGGVDYTLTNPTTVTFNSGDIAQTRNVSIDINNDTLSEGNETINLALNTLVDGTGTQVSIVAPTSHTVTIVDNDIDLNVTKAESADPVAAGSGLGNLTYTITLMNAGLTNATEVVLSEVLTIPAGVTVDSVTGSAGTNVVMNTATNYTWNVGGLDVKGSATLTAVLTVSAAATTGTDTICDTATITASNEVRVNTGDDSATECTSIVAQADLEITSKTDTPDPACVDGTITYSVSLQNNGPGPGLSTTMTDMVPASTTFVSAMVTSGTGWILTPPPGGTGNVVFSKASVANGETAVFEIVVMVNSGTLHGTSIMNTATASATLVDPVPGNNSKTATTTVDPIAPVITCPANITVSTDPNQCSAVVTYAAPTVNDNCPCGVGGGLGKKKVKTGQAFCVPVCDPPSGSTFLKGTTTVTCTTSDAAGNTASCNFSVTVNDTQPPSITCPANITAKTPNAGDPCVIVNYPPPTVSDNCPGIGFVCTPPSGSCFPLGVTTVTCTATDTSGNTATCTFKVTVFDLCVQDDSDPSTAVLINSMTGDYRFCCHGVTYTGKGTMTIRGSTYQLQHNPLDRRVLVNVDESVHKGSGSIQAPPGTIRCTITDRNTRDNSCACE